MATNTPNFSLPKPDANDNFNRTAYNALIDAIDTKVGAKTNAADTHIADLVKHITAGERDKWNAAQLFALTNSSGSSKATINADLNQTLAPGFYNVLAGDLNGQGTAGHMIVLNRGSSANTFQFLYTSNQRLYTRHTSNGGTIWSTWLEQETTTGAQSKVDAHAADAVKHITTPERDKWNGGQLAKLTLDNGRSGQKNGIDLNNEKVNNFFYVGSDALNKPEGVTAGWVQVESVSDLYVTQTFKSTLTGSATPQAVFQRTMHNGVWQPWRKYADTNLLGNVLFGNKLVDQSNANFVGKVAGSTTVNPHIAKRKSGTASSTLLAPTGFDVEFSDGVGSVGYGSIQSLDNTLSNPTYPNAGGIAQVLFSFNLIEHVQRTYGTIPGATTADKVAWLKSNLSKLTFNWFGFGSSPAGNKANISFWNGASWTYWTSNSASAPTKSVISSTGIATLVQSDGFVHFLAYAEASDGTTASVINTDYVELNVELSTDIKSGLANATQSSAGLQSGADKTKLDGISAGANKTTNPAINGSIAIDGVPTVVYAHPTGDGSSHVPATGTTNNGKVLKAGGTANALSWAFVDWSEIINKPSTYLPSAHNHAIADVTGLSTALSNKLDTSQRGAVNGVASLGADGKVPTSQLPTIANTAADITIADSGNYFDGANVETGMQEIGRVLAGSRASLVASAQQLGVI